MYLLYGVGCYTVTEMDLRAGSPTWQGHDDEDHHEHSKVPSMLLC